MEKREFGEFLRDLRQKNKLSLRQAAAESISVTYLWQIEKGSRTPSAEILKRLAPVYGVSVEYLLRVAGYLEEPNEEATDLERIEAAFRLVETDKDYKFGTYMRGEELTPEAKKYIVEVYQQTTGRKLL